MSHLTINNLHVSVSTPQLAQSAPILHGITLEIKSGEVHAVMGPNGSGKSTLAYSAAGHPFYQVTQGSIKLDGVDLIDKSPDERAALGLFLAFQYPTEVAGVKIQNFLRLAYNARFANQPQKLFPTVLGFRKHLEQLAEQLKIKPELLKRGLNEGFSGGEKKRLEILQMAVLEPKFALLDETDSGLDIDAIQAVAEGVNQIVKTHKTGILVITHYQRILNYLRPNFVHVMRAGKITQSGDFSLVEQLEKSGYSQAE